MVKGIEDKPYEESVQPEEDETEGKPHCSTTCS